MIPRISSRFLFLNGIYFNFTYLFLVDGVRRYFSKFLISDQFTKVVVTKSLQFAPNFAQVSAHIQVKSPAYQAVQLSRVECGRNVLLHWRYWKHQVRPCLHWANQATWCLLPCCWRPLWLRGQAAGARPEPQVSLSCLWLPHRLLSGEHGLLEGESSDQDANLPGSALGDGETYEVRSYFSDYPIPWCSFLIQIVLKRMLRNANGDRQSPGATGIPHMKTTFEDPTLPLAGSVVTCSAETSLV